MQFIRSSDCSRTVYHHYYIANEHGKFLSSVRIRIRKQTRCPSRPDDDSPVEYCKTSLFYAVDDRVVDDIREASTRCTRLENV